VYLTSLIPANFGLRGVEVFPLDETAWPRCAHGRRSPLCHSATADVHGAGIVVGHSYSILAWSAEPETSWVLPCSLERIESQEDAVSEPAR